MGFKVSGSGLRVNLGEHDELARGPAPPREAHLHLRHRHAPLHLLLSLRFRSGSWVRWRWLERSGIMSEGSAFTSKDVGGRDQGFGGFHRIEEGGLKVEG